MELTWKDLVEPLIDSIRETWPKEKPYTVEIQEYLEVLRNKVQILEAQKKPVPPGMTVDMYRELGKIYVSLVLEKDKPVATFRGVIRQWWGKIKVKMKEL